MQSYKAQHYYILKQTKFSNIQQGTIIVSHGKPQAGNGLIYWKNVIKFKRPRINGQKV